MALGDREHATYRPGWRLRHYTGDIWQVIEADLPGDGQWHNGMVEAPGDYLIRCVNGRERDREIRVHADYLSGSGWKLDPDSLVAENARLREAGEALADAVHGLDSYAALGGAPMERTDRADAALRAWHECLVRVACALPAPERRESG